MDSTYACDTSIGKRNYPLREITWLFLSLSLSTEVTCNLFWNGSLTQESIIRLRLEDFFWPVEEETERQEYLHVWTLLENSLVNLTSILQLAHANRVLALTIADRVQWVQYLTKWNFVILSTIGKIGFIRFLRYPQYTLFVITFTTFIIRIHHKRFTRIVTWDYEKCSSNFHFNIYF